MARIALKPLAFAACTKCGTDWPIEVFEKRGCPTCKAAAEIAAQPIPEAWRQKERRAQTPTPPFLGVERRVSQAFQGGGI